METYIVRIHRAEDDELRGTVEVPGAEPRPFSGTEALLHILGVPLVDQTGNASGSTPSSAMRET